MKKQYTVTLTLPDGSRKYFRGNTRAEAEAKRDETRRLMASGLNLTCSSRVDEWAATWLEEYKKGVVRETTYRNIYNILNLYVLPIIGDVKVRDVKPAHMRRVLKEISDKAESTQRVVIRTAKEMFKVAMENDLILKNPCTSSIKPSGRESRKVVPLTREQSETLISAAKGSKLYLFVLLALYAGLRRSELLGLMWSDVDFVEGTVTPKRSVVSGIGLTDTLKTEAAHRTIPLPWSVMHELEWAKSHSNSVYVIPGESGSYIGDAEMQTAWDRITRRLDFHVHPHLLRHTCVTRWFEMGLDIKEIQYLAGHSTAAVTMEIYTHYLEEERHQDTAEKIRAAY